MCRTDGKSCHCAPAEALTWVKRPLAPGARHRRAQHRRHPCKMPWCWAASILRQVIPCRIRSPPCCWNRGSDTVAPACSPSRLRREAQGPARAWTATRTSARRRTTASARSWLAHHPRVHAGQGQTLALIERVNRSRGLGLPSMLRDGRQGAGPARCRPAGARIAPRRRASRHPRPRSEADRL